jgi:hypothetical protein
MLSKIRYGALAAILAFSAHAGCTRIIRKGPLIDRYNAAECVPVVYGPGITPPTRAWDTTVTTRAGVVVHVKGEDMVFGRIVVKYASDGEVKVAVNAGDYIYPEDVRLDASTGRLYVRARGIAVLDGEQTWLFEYDLNRRRETGRNRVDEKVLPQLCQIK